ncbi:hypothetical protein [Halococcoides cellulosivorans]|uniref:Uncharacterized protein n=1 Tax=Halococcoides cellulosivorans TaxID=1679096 RepID=A0A2R4X1U4_9EURY|nr:hypothetical protein [Halococcoides cellulosivorans]AWB27693.1 hypothetical protein HARCEL1_08200 [Halococcoides cellulosivorans]
MVDRLYYEIGGALAAVVVLIATLMLGSTIFSAGASGPHDLTHGGAIVAIAGIALFIFIAGIGGWALARFDPGESSDD